MGIFLKITTIFSKEIEIYIILMLFIFYINEMGILLRTESLIFSVVPFYITACFKK